MHQKMLSLKALLVLIAIFFFELPGYESSQVEKRLMSRLLDEYNYRVRPVANASDSIRVNFTIALLQILDLSETDSVIKTVIWPTLEWKDATLVWNPSEYQNIKDVRIPPNQIWTPDIHLYNNVDDHFEPTVVTNAAVSSTGQITLISPAVYVSSCKLLNNNFPFDEYNCMLKFGSWTYDGAKLNLQFKNENDTSADISNYKQHRNWDLVGALGQRNEHFVSDPCCPNSYVDIAFNIHVKRRGDTIMKNARWSMVFIHMTLFFSFLLPPASSHKLTFAILHVICAWWPIWSYASNFPSLFNDSSDGGGALVFFFKTMGTLATVALFANVVTIWVFHSVGKVPSWIGQCLDSNFAKFVLISSPRSKPGLMEIANTGVDLKIDDSTPGNGNWHHLAMLLDRCFFIIFLAIAVMVDVLLIP